VKRSHRLDKLARIYDDEILPIWAHRFGRMIVRGLDLPPKAMILDVACGTGYPALEVLRKMDEQSRLIAIDASSALLDVARNKAGDAMGKRIFFRTESAFPRLPFAADVYDLVMCNLGLADMAEGSPRAALADFARVAKPGGRVAATLPLAGTWQEFYDIYREVLVKHDRTDTLDRLDAHVAALPTPQVAEDWLTQAGLLAPRVEVEEFTLLFRSAREFFFAPVVEYGPLSRWKEIAGRGDEMQEVFWHIKNAIDAYFDGRAFHITVKAGCLTGTRGERPPEEDATGKVERVAAADSGDDAVAIGSDDVEIVDGDGDGDGDGDRPDEDLDLGRGDG
jgi:ubiquinone/menaquinone biosynthesis C-methylase UbiE